MHLHAAGEDLQQKEKGPGHPACSQERVAATEKQDEKRMFILAVGGGKPRWFRPMQAEMVVVPLQKGPAVLQGFTRSSRPVWDDAW